MGFAFTLIYLALIYIRPQEYIEAVHGLPVMEYAAGISIAAVFLEGGFSADKLRRSAINWLLILFWAVICLSWVPNRYFGGVLLVFLRFANVAVLYFLIVLTVDNFRRLRIFLWVLVLMATFLAVQCVYQYYAGEGLGDVAGLARRSMQGKVFQARGVGIFADPNDLALNMVPIVAFLLPGFHRHLMSRTWLTGVIFLVPLVTGIIFTRSRGGLLGLAAVGWAYLRRQAGRTVAMVGLVVLLALLVTIPRMGEISVHEGSARSRLEHWSYGLQLFKEHPILGRGAMGGFTEDYSHTAHNSFILVLAEAGMVGALLWVAMFVAGFREIYLTMTVPRAPPWLTPFMQAMEAALIGWLVCALFLSHTYKHLSFLLLGLVVAGLNSLAAAGIPVSHPWTLRQSVITLLASVGGIILMHVALRLLWYL